MNMILTQYIGLVSYIILSVSYFEKEKRKILFLQIISYIMFVIYYYLLDARTGAICNLIGLFAFITIYVFDKYKLKNKNILVMLFIIGLLIINIVTFQNVFSIFPIIASISVILSFLIESEDIIRGIGIISAVCWLIYAIAYKSYIAIAFEILTLIIVTIAFIKNTRNPKVEF